LLYLNIVSLGIGWGWIADRFGRHFPLLVAQLSGAIFTLVLGAVPLLPMVMINIMALGLTIDSLSIWRTIVGDITTAKKSRQLL
jgi:MFS family permease